MRQPRLDQKSCRARMTSWKYMGSGGVLLARTGASSRRPPALVKPGSVAFHLGELRLGGVGPTRRRLVASQGRPPTALDTVVGIYPHPERGLAIAAVCQSQLPVRAVASRVLEPALPKLSHDALLEVALHLGRRFPRRHRVPFGSPRHARGEGARDVDRDEEAQVSRRRRIILPLAGCFNDLRAVRHVCGRLSARQELAAVFDGNPPSLHLLPERLVLLLHTRRR